VRAIRTRTTGPTSRNTKASSGAPLRAIARRRVYDQRGSWRFRGGWVEAPHEREELEVRPRSVDANAARGQRQLGSGRGETTGTGTGHPRAVARGHRNRPAEPTTTKASGCSRAPGEYRAEPDDQTSDRVDGVGLKAVCNRNVRPEPPEWTISVTTVSGSNESTTRRGSGSDDIGHTGGPALRWPRERRMGNHGVTPGGLPTSDRIAEAAMWVWEFRLQVTPIECSRISARGGRISARFRRHGGAACFGRGGVENRGDGEGLVINGWRRRASCPRREHPGQTTWEVIEQSKTPRPQTFRDTRWPRLGRRPLKGRGGTAPTAWFIHVFPVDNYPATRPSGLAGARNRLGYSVST